MPSTHSRESTRTLYRPVRTITVSHIKQVDELHVSLYENTSLDIFVNDLSKKSGVILVTRKSDERAVGFSTQTCFELAVNGRPVRGDVAEITPKLKAANPHIAFFERANPEWRRGTELPCVGSCDDESVLRACVWTCR